MNGSSWGKMFESELHIRKPLLKQNTFHFKLIHDSQTSDNSGARFSLPLSNTCLSQSPDNSLILPKNEVMVFMKSRQAEPHNSKGRFPNRGHRGSTCAPLTSITHGSPKTEGKPSTLQFMGLRRVRHD